MDFKVSIAIRTLVSYADPNVSNTHAFRSGYKINATAHVLYSHQLLPFHFAMEQILLLLIAALPITGVFGVGGGPNCANMPIKKNDYEDDSSVPPQVFMNTSLIGKLRFNATCWSTTL